jgi:hypothetical protein
VFDKEFDRKFDRKFDREFNKEFDREFDKEFDIEFDIEFRQNFKQDSNVTFYQLEVSSKSNRDHISRSSKSILTSRIFELSMMILLATRLSTYTSISVSAFCIASNSLD